jgi:Protein of unknown function (DUF4012)
VAHQVLLVSSDPFLVASLKVAARGHFAVLRIDPAVEPAGWPWQAASAVVLDVAPEQRAGVSAWVRRHHSGPLVMLLTPDEPDTLPPNDPARVVVRRPFRIIDLVDILTAPAGPEAAARERLRPSSRPATDGRELQPAGVEQRRRRLEPVAGGGARPRPVTSRARPAAPPTRPPAPRTSAPPRPARPAPGGRPPATGWFTSKRRRRAARRRLIVRSTLLGALVALLLSGGWLALGLLEARQELRLVAGSVRSDLTRAEAALRRDDLGVAGAALRDASRSIDVAEAVTERPPVRVAARLPLLSDGVRDAGHLLNATRELIRAGDHAVLLAGHLQPGGSALLERGRFDLRALEGANDQTSLLAAELERARAELQQIRGGPLSEGLQETRGWALGRVDDARARVRGIRSTLETLPVALGVGRPQTYLIALLTPAELRPSGGVPLAVMEVELDDGAVRVRSHGGDIAENVHNVQTTWKAVAGDPWASGGSFTRFSEATSSPDFPTAGQELLRAYAARTRRRADVVVTLDPLAMRGMLQASGPITVPGYGRLTADSVVRRTTHDAYVTWPDRVVRRRHNELLLDALVDRFLSGRELIATSRALGAAGARRNVQMYAVDPRLQRLLAGQRLAGGLGPADHDYLAVHTLNTNRSRVDYFQRRTVRGDHPHHRRRQRRPGRRAARPERRGRLRLRPRRLGPGHLPAVGRHARLGDPRRPGGATGRDAGAWPPAPAAPTGAGTGQVGGAHRPLPGEGRGGAGRSRPPLPARRRPAGADRAAHPADRSPRPSRHAGRRRRRLGRPGRRHGRPRAAVRRSHRRHPRPAPSLTGRVRR